MVAMQVDMQAVVPGGYPMVAEFIPGNLFLIGSEDRITLVDLEVVAVSTIPAAVAVVAIPAVVEEAGAAKAQMRPVAVEALSTPEQIKIMNPGTEILTV